MDTLQTLARDLEQLNLRLGEVEVVLEYVSLVEQDRKPLPHLALGAIGHELELAVARLRSAASEHGSARLTSAV